MKKLQDFILEYYLATSDEANDLATKTLKKLVNKIIDLDKLKDILGKDGWLLESDEDNVLYFVINLSNNSEGENNSLMINYEKSSDKIKIISYEVE